MGARRPVTRDNDAMAGLLGRLKDQVAQLASRTSIPVGKLWRVEESPEDQNLVAMLPGQNVRVVLASPDGQCGTTLECVGQSLDGTLVYDRAGHRIAVRISADAGNGLSVGSDGGLYAGAGGARTWVFRFSAEGAPAGQDMRAYDSRVGEPFAATAWAWPQDPGAESLVPGTGVNGSAALYHNGLGSGLIRYDNSHTAPGSQMAVRFPALHTGMAGGGLYRIENPYAQLGWWLGPWDGVMLTQMGPWFGAWWEVSFKLFLTGYPSGSERVCIFENWPGMRLWIGWGGQLGWTAESMTDPHDHAHSNQHDMFTDVPLGQWVKIVVRVSRGGAGSYVRLFLHPDDPAPAEQVGIDKINTDDLGWDAPMYLFGPLLDARFFDPPIVYPTAPPVVTFPECWMDDIELSYDAPAEPLPARPA